MVTKARGNATYDKPPMSNHFSDAQKLRIPGNVAPLHAITDSMPFMSTHQPVDYANQLMFYQMFQNPMSMFSNAFGQAQSFPPAQPFGTSSRQHLSPVTPFATAPPTPASYVTSAPASSPAPATPALAPAAASPGVAITLPRPISYEEFTAFYKLPESDITKLETLEVRLGDRAVEGLQREDWHGEANFSKLGWGRFLVAHRQFIKDVLSGVWDAHEAAA